MRTLRAWLGFPVWQPREVIVNLHGDGGSISGVLWELGEYLLIRNAAYIAEGSTIETPADGEILVHRPQVTFIQVLPPRAAMSPPRQQSPT